MIPETNLTIQNRVGRDIFLTFTPALTTATSDTVLMMHGFKGFRNWSFWPHVAQALAIAGFHVLRMDFSLNGMQGGNDRIVSPEDFAANTLTREVDDAHDVLHALRSFDGFTPWRSRMTNRVHLLGHSRGGGIAQVVGREMLEAGDNLGYVVGWNSIGRWGRHSERQRAQWIKTGYMEVEHSRTGQTLRMNESYVHDLEAHEERLRLLSAVRALSSKLLFLHSETDLTVSIIEIQRLLKEAESKAYLTEIEGSTHTFGMMHPVESITGSLAKVVKLTIRHLQS